MGRRVAPRVLFLNQVAGPLFRELAQDLAAEFSPSVLYTGQADTIATGATRDLTVVAGPAYRRGSAAQRLRTWGAYFALASLRALRCGRDTRLFIVSNPPFLGLVGYLLRKLRGQRYAILVYDIYPDLLVATGRLGPRHPLVRAWRRVNRLVLEHADAVFTIGEGMAGTLAAQFDPRRTRAGRVLVVPNWADETAIRPMPKAENEFAREHGQTERLTVLYSGNLGESHDLDTLVDAAGQVAGHPSLHFLIVGDGAKREALAWRVREAGLRNVSLLPLQPEARLPALLATGDVAVVTLERGAGRLSFPSKTFYAMAAGSAILAIADPDSDLAQLVRTYDMGVALPPGDAAGVAVALRAFADDAAWLARCRANARRALEQHHTRANTRRYSEALRALAEPRVPAPAAAK